MRRVVDTRASKSRPASMLRRSVALLGALATAAIIPSGGAAVATPPTAAFSPGDGTHLVNEAIPFQDLSANGSAPITDWLWTFDDGTQSVEPSPVHRFTAPGSYNVTLRVTDQGALNGTAVHNFTLTAATLAPQFTSPTSSATGENITFFDVTVGGTGNLTRSWTFGDGGTSTSIDPTHAYASPGTYTVHEQVTDEAAHVATVEHVVNVYTRSTADVAMLYGQTRTVTMPDGSTVAYHSISNTTQLDVIVRQGLTAAVFVEDSVADYSNAGSQALTYFEAEPQIDHTRDGFDRITISIPYDPTLLAARGLSASSLAIYYWSGLAWVNTRSPGTFPHTITTSNPSADLVVFAAGVDTATRHVFATVDHTSGFAVIGSAAGGGTPTSSTTSTSTNVTGSPPSATTVPAIPPALPTPQGGPLPSTAGSGAADAAGSTVHLLVTDHAQTLRPGTTVSGPLLLTVENATDQGAHVSIIVRGPDGEHILGNASEPRPWDPATVPNGEYTIIARANQTDGSTVILDSFQVTVVHARASTTATLSAVAIGVAIAVAAATVGAVGTTLEELLIEVGRDTATGMTEDKVSETSARRSVSWLRRFRIGPWTATLIALALVGALFAYEAVTRPALDLWRRAFLYVGLPSMALFALGYGLDFLLARADGAKPRLRLLPSGAVALAISSLVFHAPFGNPASIDEDDEDGDDENDAPSRRTEALKSVASVLAVLAFLGPLYLVGVNGAFGLMEAGFAVVFTLVAGQCLPVPPQPGADVWRWRKSIALALAIGGLGLYVSFFLAWIPMAGFGLVGACALGLFLALLAWMSLRRREIPEPLFLSACRAVERIALLLLAAVPRPVRRLATRTSEAWDRGVDAVLRRLAARFARLRHRAGPTEA